MDITIEVTEIIAESTINETVIYCDVVISDAGGSMVDVPIETASANGVPIPIINKNIDIIIPTKTSDLTKDDVYTKSETFSQTEINNKLSAVYEFKGSVPTYAELPTNAENADVYNVEENGINYAWVQVTESWDSLGGLIGLATLTENGLLSKEDFALLRNLYTADEIDQLLLGFAKLSGGNDFLNTQNFDGRINHKAGEYFYTAASKTADAVNDTRVINSAGVEIHSICTALGATKGGGTWANYLKIERQGGVITNISSIDIMQIQAGNGSLILRGFDGVLLRTVLFECMYIDLYGNISTLSSKYQYNATSLTADTINDTRTVNTSGLLELFKCSLGNATKGLGTWIYGRLKLGMVIETEINEYADNAAALAAGLTAGMKYRTGDLYKIVH